MAISRPMGSAPTGVSTGDEVTKLDIGIGPKPAIPSCCEAPSISHRDPLRQELDELRLKAAIKKQKAILSGELPIKDAPDYP